MFTVFFIFFCSLLAGAMFICGWFAITRGKYVTQPDGREVWKGKIFSFWQRYWEQHTCLKKVYYSGKQLKLLMLQIEPLFGLSEGSLAIAAGGIAYRFNQDAPNPMCIIVNTNTMLLFKSRFHVIQGGNPELECLIKRGQNDEYYVMFFKTEKNYFFSQKFRDPLASCIYCHSSLYGSLIWLTVFLISKHCHTGVCGLVAFVLWIPFIICLSYLTPFLWKKLN